MHTFFPFYKIQVEIYFMLNLLTLTFNIPVEKKVKGYP